MLKTEEVHFFRCVLNWILLLLTFFLFFFGIYLSEKIGVSLDSAEGNLFFGLWHFVFPTPLMISFFLQSKKCKIKDRKRYKRYRAFGVYTICFIIGGAFSLFSEFFNMK